MIRVLEHFSYACHNLQRCKTFWRGHCPISSCIPTYNKQQDTSTKKASVRPCLKDVQLISHSWYWACLRTVFAGKDAKFVETIDEEDENAGKNLCVENGQSWLTEPDIPVYQSVFEISEQPFSAINPSLLPDSITDVPEMYAFFKNSLKILVMTAVKRLHLI